MKLAFDESEKFMLSEAVLFIIFNRPDTTTKVFESIRSARPPRLYIAADGPRNDIEREKCASTRKIVANIDWPCEVFHLFREENLGCRYAVSSAIDWFFENEEEGIILEDDCLPHPDFFRFCETLLDKYRDDSQIMHIGGSNFQLGKKRGAGSFYLSRYAHIWGWASWRRAWEKYDVDINDFEKFKRKGIIREIFKSFLMRKYWLYILNRVYKKRIDTWDFQWTYAVFKNNSYAIIPNSNMISNIGFGGGTNTLGGSIYANMPVESMEEIVYPEEKHVDEAADKYYFRTSLLDCMKHLLLRKLGIKH